jgi:hypothetical protein
MVGVVGGWGVSCFIDCLANLSGLIPELFVWQVFANLPDRKDRRKFGHHQTGINRKTASSG